MVHGNGKGKVRVQVVVSQEMCDRIDYYSKKFGLSRSALCCQLVGQGIMNYDAAYELAANMGKQMLQASDTVNEKEKGG